MRADLFELSDVLAASFRCRRQRPESFDVIPAHVEEAGADRRKQPFVQAGAVEIAAEILHRERELTERVCAVDDRS